MELEPLITLYSEESKALARGSAEWRALYEKRMLIAWIAIVIDRETEGLTIR